MNFVIVGLSHKTAPLEIREKLAVPDSEVPRLLVKLLQQEAVREGMLISTCNRVEALLVAEDSALAIDAARRLFLELGKLHEADLAKYVYVKNKEEAAAHLFRVTAGLDSLVVGEPQIQSQVKEAFARSSEAKAAGVYLNKLVSKSLNVAKRIRTETDIGRHPVSISYAAVLLAEKIFGDLNGTRALLIGAGEMGELAARHLAERRIREILLANRDLEKAEALARALGAKAVPLDKAMDNLFEADIVITSTASENFLVGEDAVKHAMRQRRNRPMFFIDISVPRNVDPKINRIENVYLYDIDHLKAIVETNLRTREREALRAEEIISEEVGDFLDYVGQMALSPTIEQLSKKFDQIRRSELAKYLAKRPDLASDDREMLEACTRAMVNKILHEPILTMKKEEPKEGGPRYSEILKKLFKLE
jgi:glutamyl-tRNA reductase